MGLMVATILPCVKAASAPISSNGAVDFYNAADLTAGDTTWSDSGSSSGDNIDLSFRNDGSASAPNGGMVDDSPATETAIEQAVSFNGTYQFQYGSGGFRTSDATASVEVWFKPATLIDEQMLFETGGGLNGTGIGLNGSTLEASSNSSAASFDLANVDLDEFIQVVVANDSDDGTVGSWRFYVNGRLEGTGSANNDFSGTDQTAIGGIESGATSGVPQPTDAAANNVEAPFDGQIGLVRIYDTALSDQNVKTSFNAIVPEPSSLMLGIVGFGGLALLRRQRA
jgi:hypothetical protein